jgi:protein-tyrosine phosphatase
VSDGDITRVLVVCSANQCRSPLAAAILADRLARRRIATSVESAGVRAMEGVAATEPTVVAAARLGLDLSGHASRRAVVDAVQAADLVLTMERAQLREVVVLDPTAFSRAFTLKELVRRGADLGPVPLDASPLDRLALVGAGRRPVDLLGSSRDDDVEDPTGSRFADHETMAREVSELVDEMVELLWPEES